MKARLSPIFLLAACAPFGFDASTADAAVLFSNGTASEFGGFNRFSYEDVFVAQDFVLTSSTSLSAVVFNAFSLTEPAPNIASVQVKIYADNAGAVGAELYGGVFAPTSIFTEQRASFSHYDFTAALPGWTLAAGNYWLGLQADPAQVDVMWSIPAANIGQGVYGSWYGNNAGDPSAYTPFAYEHVFRVEGDYQPSVPDLVSTFSLMLLALGGGVLARQRSHSGW
ncbi:MAG: hypothetical protein HZC55_05505 [Verrucomicrobia bacterium]|nr:hypothetical protein [Verrucomicrobiota bacterium]